MTSDPNAAKGGQIKVVLAQPRGFCAGVERAIDIVERALEKFGAPVYVRHEIVHNKYVVDTLRERGAIFVEEVDEIPTGAVTVFSAHGVSKKVEDGALVRELDVIDATCPLVTKVHKEGRRYAAKGYDIVLIGHIGHPEVEGTLGQIPGTVHVLSEVEEVERLEVADPERVAFVTQTTLSVNDTKDVIAALKNRFPSIIGPDTRDICYATQNRQTAVIAMAKQVDLLLVVGAHNSSNSNRLREIGENFGIPSYLIEDASMFDPAWLSDSVKTVGVTAGASAPEKLVQQAIERLKNYRDVTVETLDGVEENIHFKLPRELADVPRSDQTRTSRIKPKCQSPCISKSASAPMWRSKPCWAGKSTRWFCSWSPCSGATSPVPAVARSIIPRPS
jgi:4-hydroxy-3-methylbut-2-enyl diphosphate reductase